MELNINVTAKIAEFAKANKVSRAKIEALAVELLKEAGGKAGGGRKASDETLKLRERFMNVQKEFGLRGFTSVELAALYGADVVAINNVLNYFEKLGKVVKAGLAQKEEGKRGRRQVIWELTA